MYGSYQVTSLPGVTEEVICTIHPLSIDCYKRVTKRLPSFIGKLYGSYQVTRLPGITEEVICTIHIISVAFTSQLPNGYQAL